jgi:hypothetical protein
MPDSIELTLLVNRGETDAEERDRATRLLRTELQDLPVDTVSVPTSGKLPAGAKAGDALAVGALAVSLAPVVVPSLVNFLRTWMTRKEGRSIVIRKKVGDTATEIEIKAPLSESAISELIERIAPQKKRSRT